MLYKHLAPVLLSQNRAWSTTKQRVLRSAAHLSNSRTPRKKTAISQNEEIAKPLPERVGLSFLFSAEEQRTQPHTNFDAAREVVRFSDICIMSASSAPHRQQCPGPKAPLCSTQTRSAPPKPNPPIVQPPLSAGTCFSLCLVHYSHDQDQGAIPRRAG